MRVTHPAIIDARFSKMSVDIVEFATLSSLVSWLDGDRLWDKILERWFLAGFDWDGRRH